MLSAPIKAGVKAVRSPVEPERSTGWIKLATAQFWRQESVLNQIWI